MIRRLTPAWRARATLAACILPPLVHVVSMERIARWIAATPVCVPPDSSVDDIALADWIDRLLLRLPPPWRHTCLKRALVLHYLLHRAGRGAELRIGVRRDEGNALAAHAWLAHQGIPYLEIGAERIDQYQLLTVFPSVAGKGS